MDIRREEPFFGDEIYRKHIFFGACLGPFLSVLVSVGLFVVVAVSMQLSHRNGMCKTG
jgi:hypothetical protein